MCWRCEGRAGRVVLARLLLWPSIQGSQFDLSMHWRVHRGQGPLCPYRACLYVRLVCISTVSLYLYVFASLCGIMLVSFLILKAQIPAEIQVLMSLLRCAFPVINEKQRSPLLSADTLRKENRGVNIFWFSPPNKPLLLLLQMIVCFWVTTGWLSLLAPTCSTMCSFRTQMTQTLLNN